MKLSGKYQYNKKKRWILHISIWPETMYSTCRSHKSGIFGAYCATDWVVIFEEYLNDTVSLRFALCVLRVCTDPNKFYFIYFQCQGFSSHPREPCISWMCKWKTGFTTTDVWHAIDTQERPDKAIVPASLSLVREHQNIQCENDASIHVSHWLKILNKYHQTPCNVTLFAA